MRDGKLRVRVVIGGKEVTFLGRSGSAEERRSRNGFPGRFRYLG